MNKAFVGAVAVILIIGAGLLVPVLFAQPDTRERRTVPNQDKTLLAPAQPVNPVALPAVPPAYRDRDVDSFMDVDLPAPSAGSNSKEQLEEQWQRARESQKAIGLQIKILENQLQAIKLQELLSGVRVSASSAATSDKGPQPISPPVTMPFVGPPFPVKWEYKVSITSGPLQEFQLNELGADRWELVQVVTKEDYAFHTLFKRPKP